MTNDITITYSEGRCKGAQRYAYIRPAEDCHNKSHRVKADIATVNDFINRNFPVVKYFLVDGHVIGAKDDRAALKEYWRICEVSKIRQEFEVKEIKYKEHP